MLANAANYRFFYHLYSHKIFFWLFIAFFSLQIFFWKKTENIKPPFEIVPPAPSSYFIAAASLGDKEFLFRALATRLQNSGDVFAGFIALNNYDYSRVYQWLKVLDGINPKADFAPALASYYYAQTQKKEDNKYIVDYLDEHASRDIDAKWWWLFQAIYIAQRDLNDLDLALELAYKLSKNNNPNAPIWTKEVPAFIHAKMGNDCMAFNAIKKMVDASESGARQITPEEMNFIKRFIQDTLLRLQKKSFDPRGC